MKPQRPPKPTATRAHMLGLDNRAAYIKLKSQNEAHRMSVGIFEGCLFNKPSIPLQLTAANAAKAIERRAAHIEALGEIPFFRRLLTRKVPINIMVGGRSHQFTLLANGIRLNVGSAMARVKRMEYRIVVVLDKWGRKMLFYKSSGTESGLAGKWLPFKEIGYGTKRSGRLDYGIWKYEGHPDFPDNPLVNGISQAIGEQEGLINTRRVDNEYYVRAINDLL